MSRCEVVRDVSGRAMRLMGGRSVGEGGSGSDRHLWGGGVISDVVLFSLRDAPPLWSCVSPRCRPRRVARRTYSAAFPGKAALIR
jgi:hypothetical protein